MKNSLQIVKNNINNEIYEIFPNVKMISSQELMSYNSQFVNFNIFNSNLEKSIYTICHNENYIFLINKFIQTKNVYIFPLINNAYLHFITNRGIYISYIFKYEQWYEFVGNGYSCAINSKYIDEFLHKIFSLSNLNISYTIFKNNIKKILKLVKANELLTTL